MISTTMPNEESAPPVYAQQTPTSTDTDGAQAVPLHQQQAYGAPPPPQATTVYSHQAPYAQFGNVRPKEWSTGLCACGGDDDFGEFCVSCWCPCIGYSRYKTRLESLQQSGMAIPRGEAPACGPSGAIYFAVHCLTGLGLGFIFDSMARSEIRTRYNIRGNALGDCCTAWCCIPCTQGQHSREIRREEEAVRARTHGQQVQQPQRQPQMMAYPPAGADEHKAAT
ncbi:hypothetical protein JCM10908_006848 [Rhodotorula pacifica]|uniref:PLAC8 family protein n=1 Tax=Rhodotorula pacifica TaxID=1495444 RepID=UPI003173082B